MTFWPSMRKHGCPQWASFQAGCLLRLVDWDVERDVLFHVVVQRVGQYLSNRGRCCCGALLRQVNLPSQRQLLRALAFVSVEEYKFFVRMLFFGLCVMLMSSAPGGS